MAIPYTVTDVDINRVSESFVQSNAQNFAVASSIPKALCLDRYSGRSNTTSYDLAALENSLVAAEVSDWSPGVDPPGPLQLAETSVSFSVDIKTTRSIVRPFRQGATFEQRLTDLETNIVPIQLSKIYQAQDLALASLMVGASFAEQSWTGTAAKGLDDAGDYANQNPIKDIETPLSLIRPYVNFSGLELRAYMSGKVASVLAQHPAYTGGGSGSGVASGLPRAAFIERFSALHGCRTFIFDNLVNSAAYGASASIVQTFNQSNTSAVLFFGLFDTRGGFDLRSEATMSAPDGAIVCGESLAPTVTSATNDRTQVQEFWGQGGFSLYSPRGTGAGPASDLGFFMRAEATVAATGIFT